MQTLQLPDSVKGRSCFQQFIGPVAVDRAFFDQAVATIQNIGMPAIWAANDKNPPSTFNPSILGLANVLLSQGIEVKVPTAQAGDEGAVDEAGIPAYVISNGTAIIPVNGPLSKQTSSLNSLFGGSNTVGMRKALSLAMADSRVERIMFHVDSPGGTVAGTGDLGDDIFAASTRKPIAAYIEDMGTSAAYWLASQAAEITASPYANVGSIGVIWTVYDTSEAAQKQGIKVHAITSSPGKAFYVDGMPLTKQQLAKMQAHVDATYQHFLGVVARGRGVSFEQARAMSGDADIYPAMEALEKGMVDGIMPFGEALAQFQAKGKDLLRKGPARVAVRMVSRKSNQALQGVEVDVLSTLGDGPAALSTAPAANDANISGASDGASNTGPVIEPHEASPVSPDPDSAAPLKPMAHATISAEEHAKLKQDAAAGAKALQIVEKMQADAEKAKDVALVNARDDAMANHGLTKAQVDACPTMGALNALIEVKAGPQGKRTGADPAGGKGAVDAKEDYSKVPDAWAPMYGADHASPIPLEVKA